jgi:hypothetical protein
MSGIRKRLASTAVAAFVLTAGITGAVYASGRGATDAGVPAGGPSKNASIALSNCKLPKADFITNDTTGLSTASTSYAAVPGMTKTITIPGSVVSCVVVDASAFAFAPGGALEYVSVTLDGNLGSPTELQFAGDTKGSWAEAHAGVFAFPNVAPGNHSVALVFKSLDGSTVFLHRPAMEIQHK